MYYHRADWDRCDLFILVNEVKYGISIVFSFDNDAIRLIFHFET